MRVNPPWKTKRNVGHLGTANRIPLRRNEFVFFLSVSKSSSKQQKPSKTCSRVHLYTTTTTRIIDPHTFFFPHNVTISSCRPTSTENNSHDPLLIDTHPDDPQKDNNERLRNKVRNRQLQTFPPLKQRQHEHFHSHRPSLQHEKQKKRKNNIGKPFSLSFHSRQ